ncbi:ABC transporter substrate-binding protein [Geomicrobium sp. JCM 19039]|uniref:ABC transporter substrate-binding protein n=1 Tax=Geomicrobium sp. JCM 19039 TaxID=1460636 RepID=UPI00045F18E9|nr:ABC transporter substrate-binding protein [Geomicrobium sp. JCM 19039]GAK13127.1 possible alpha-xyloside ABC transporter, substrate-binding component [Geomicrobium sp. JCM 19039]
MFKKTMGVGSLILLLGACSGESIDEMGNTEGETDVEGGNSGEVTLWYYFTGNQEDLFVELIEEYNDSQDEVEVVGEYIPFPDIAQQLSVGIAGGNLPDLVFLDNVDNASFAAMDVLEDMTPLVEDWEELEHFYEGPLQSAMHDGKHYGLPFASNALGLYYNEELLNEAGVEPPETWDELREYAEMLTNDHIQGFAMSAVRSEEGAFQFYPFLKSTGADYDRLNTEEGIRSLEFLKSLMDDGSMSSDVLNATQDDLARQFAQENLAMMINGPWNIDRLTSENPDLEFGITQIPRDEEHASVLGGENLAIIRDSNVEDSWEFFQWLFEPERYEQYTADTGVFPARQDILEGSDFWSEDPYLSGFVPIMEDAHPRGPSPEWPQISEVLQLALQEVLTDSSTPEEAMENAENQIDDISGE